MRLEVRKSKQCSNSVLLEERVHRNWDRGRLLSRRRECIVDGEALDTMIVLDPVES